jgi:4-diphosphocytidyl-2-C-methyl-D-erythritol kinase
MILLPPCKINLGLRILRKREDGFHELESCFYPVQLHDMLEVIPAGTGDSVFTFSGITIDAPLESNLVYRAWRLLSALYKLPAIRLHLHKQIPMGAGLGGGSADGSYTLKILSEIFDLHLSPEALHHYATELGSDCAFFMKEEACMAYGRGEVLRPLQLSLAGWYIVLVKPDIHISTQEAFRSIRPSVPVNNLEDLLKLPLSEWKDLVCNDFEAPVFLKYPQIRHIKEELYRNGAEFALMSGSGSAVFGLFRDKPGLKEHFHGNFVYEDLLTG